MSDPDYGRNHDRVKRAFGKASDYQCTLCFSVARDWAYLWQLNSDPADPDNYVPLCRQDHMDYDWYQREAARRVWTGKKRPEHSVVMMGNQYRLGIEHDAESRDKMHAAAAARKAKGIPGNRKGSKDSAETRARKSAARRAYLRRQS